MSHIIATFPPLLPSKHPFHINSFVNTYLVLDLVLIDLGALSLLPRLTVLPMLGPAS